MENDELVIEKLSKKQLNEEIRSIFMESGFAIEKIDIECEPCVVKLNDGVRKFELHYILKNISHGGWTDSYKNKKRIQVGNVRNNLVSTNKIRTHMLCGIQKVRDKKILIVWNSYRYTSHNTNCSCYVDVDEIKKCYKIGYCMAKGYDQEIWLCDEKHFGLLIRDYISFNYVME